jgi:hypothetical protein
MLGMKSRKIKFSADKSPEGPLKNDKYMKNPYQVLLSERLLCSLSFLVGPGGRIRNRVFVNIGLPGPMNERHLNIYICPFGYNA